MVPNTRQIVLFLVGCICSRIIISLVAKNTPSDKLPMLGIIALIPAFGFIHMYLNKDKQNGDKRFSGVMIWWKNLRLFHAFMYFMFAYSAINKDKNAWKILFADAIIGLLAWYFHYYGQVDF